MRHIFNVNTARRDIGRDKDLRTAEFKAVERRDALVLAFITVNNRRFDARSFERNKQTVRARFGFREHNDGGHGVAVLGHKTHEEFRFLIMRHRINGVSNTHRRCRLRAYLHRDRIMTHGVCQLHDLFGHRRRKNQILPLGRQKGDDLPDIRQETHVHHAVGLVQNKHFKIRKVHMTLIHVVQQTPGCRRNDLHALL